MKKLLSMLLALAMVMSLFCVVPAAAETTSTEFTLPYVNYDFNDMTEGTAPSDSYGSWNASGVIEGVAGGKALYKESTAVSSGSAYLSYTLVGHSPAVMTSGEPFKMSFWLKLNTEKTRFADASNPSSLQITYTANGGAKGYKAYNFGAQIAALNTGEWVYYEQTIAGWDGKFGTYDTITNPDGATLAMQFRLGYVNGTGPAGVLAAGYNTTYAIAIDDFRIEPVRTPYDPDAVVEYVEPVETVYENTNAYFGSSAAGATNTTLGGVARKVYVAKTGGTTGDSTNKYISVANSNNTYYIHWTNPIWMDYNKLHKITFWARAEDAANVGTKVNIRLLNEIRTDNINDPNTNYATTLGSQYEVYDGITLTTEWQKCEIWRKRNLTTVDRSRVRLYMEYVAAEGTEIHVGLDDIKIEAYPDVTNGAFEATSHGVETSHHSATPYGHNDSAKYVSGLYGWLAKDATVTAVTSGAHGGSQAAKVVTTAANGSIYQGMFFENGATKNITFYAKGEGSSIGQPISLVMDRTATLVSTYDVYDVPEIETLTVTGEDGNANLTADWKKFTVSYSPNFTAFRSGITALPALTANAQNIGPRQPMMKFKVGDGSAGYTYYLDDLTIRAPKTAHPYPFVTDYDMVEKNDLSSVTNVVEGKPVYIDYLTDTEVTSDSVEAAVVRVMIESKAGSNKYGTYATIIDDGAVGLQDFTIPEGFVGKKIKISVQPFSTNGKVGAHYEKVIGTIAKQYEASMTVGAYVPASSSVTTTYSVTNNKVDGSTVRAIMFTMFYAEDGTMVKCVQNPVVVANGTTVTNATFTATSTVSDTNLPAVASAKVFFWFTEGTDTPSVFNTSMEEVLPVEDVAFPS